MESGCDPDAWVVREGKKAGAMFGAEVRGDTGCQKGSIIKGIEKIEFRELEMTLGVDHRFRSNNQAGRAPFPSPRRSQGGEGKGAFQSDAWPSHEAGVRVRGGR